MLIIETSIPGLLSIGAITRGILLIIYDCMNFERFCQYENIAESVHVMAEAGMI